MRSTLHTVMFNLGTLGLFTSKPPRCLGPLEDIRFETGLEVNTGLEEGTQERNCHPGTTTKPRDSETYVYT